MVNRKEALTLLHAAGGAVEEDCACKHRDMAAERGGGDGHIDDNMGNELQLLAAGNN